MHLINKYNVNNQEFTFIEIIQDDIKVTLMDYGATLMSIFVPDKDGKYETVLIAYDSLDSYINNKIYLNATIGPNAGRIKNGKFTLNGKDIQLDLNDGGVANLHGGKETYAYKFFKYDIHDAIDYTRVTFTYETQKEGTRFPGNQRIKIAYTVTKKELLIEFMGETDEDTLLNMTNHAYFNLSGNLKYDIKNHHLFLNSNHFLDLDEDFVPYKVKPVKDTFLDFTTLKEIGPNFKEGLDHPYLLNEVNFEIPQAVLFDPISKRQMEVFTTYETLVCYTHNSPDDKPFLFGAPNRKHMSICFEAEHTPNGINIDGLEDSILKKDDIYYEKTLFKFSVKE